jgi:hypothetical protein
MIVDHRLRDRISSAVTEALRPLPAVFAGWEGGSAAFGAVDAYSDIDLEYLVADDACFEFLYAPAERAIETVSPITASHTPVKGRYYKLKDGGDFLLVDLIFSELAIPIATSRFSDTATRCLFSTRETGCGARPSTKRRLRSNERSAIGSFGRGFQ